MVLPVEHRDGDKHASTNARAHYPRADARSRSISRSTVHRAQPYRMKMSNASERIVITPGPSQPVPGREVVITVKALLAGKHLTGWKNSTWGSSSFLLLRSYCPGTP